MQPQNRGGSLSYPASRLPLESQTFTLLMFVTLVFIFVTSMNLYTEAGKENAQKMHPKETQPRNITKNNENSNVCRDIFEIGKVSSNMTEWMTNAVKVIGAYKRIKKFIPNWYYEMVGFESPSMIRQVNDSSGILGSNITIAKVR